MNKELELEELGLVMVHARFYGITPKLFIEIETKHKELGLKYGPCKIDKVTRTNFGGCNKQECPLCMGGLDSRHYRGRPLYDKYEKEYVKIYNKNESGQKTRFDDDILDTRKYSEIVIAIKKIKGII